MSTDASDSAPHGAPGQPKQILGVTTEFTPHRMMDYRLPLEAQQIMPLPPEYDPTRFAYVPTPDMPIPNFISTIGGKRPEDAQQELRAQEQSRQTEIAKLVEERKLRDQFAMAALSQAIDIAMVSPLIPRKEITVEELAAVVAYGFADAMLKFRAMEPAAKKAGS
jgi:hypothetical protein